MAVTVPRGVESVKSSSTLTVTPPPAPPAPALALAAPAAPAEPAPASPAPSPTTGVTQIPSVMSAATVQRQGLPVTTDVPAGVKVVEYQVVQTSGAARVAAASVSSASARSAAVRGRVLAKLYRFPRRAGLFKVRLKSKALTRALKPGRYVLTVRMGKSRATLGSARTMRFSLRR